MPIDPNTGLPDKRKPKPKPKPNPKPKTSGGTSAGGSSGGSAGSSRATSSGGGVDLTQYYTNAYASLFPDNNRRSFKPPKELLELAIKNKWGIERIAGWVRNNQKDAWIHTKMALDRAAEMDKALESIFGRFEAGSAEAKEIAKLIKNYIFKEPNRWQAYQFVSDFVATTNLFRAQFPGWEQFSRTAAAQTDILSAVRNYKDLKDGYVKQYRATLGDLTAVIPAELLQMAFENGWTNDEVDAWTRQNDPKWLGSTGAKDRGEAFDDFWKTMFGEVSIDQDLKSKYQRSGEKVTMADFFNNFIEDSELFKATHPGYAAWKAAQFEGLPGDELHVNPFDYFERRAQLKLAYDKLTEGKGPINWELIDKALANNWDEERLAIEFKNVDPAYMATSEATQRAANFKTYWQSLFGSQSIPDVGLAADYVSSNLSDPSDLFDRIRNTSEFQSQYGSWDEFAAAQDAKGNTSAILNNPALYKRYRDMIRTAFENVGLMPPDDSMLFRSGVDEGEVAGYLDTYMSGLVSYQWQTGKQADPLEVAGMQGEQKAGDIRMRFHKAISRHRTYAGSANIAPQASETEGSGLIKQRI